MRGPVRPLFSYFGSKWRIAKTYAPPQNPLIVEPFAGSAAYALHYPDRKVHLYELHPGVAEVWRYLIQAKASEIRRLPILREGESLEDFKLGSAERNLLRLWVQQASHYPGSDRCTSFGAAKWTPAKRDRVASQLDRIRHWKVFERSYERAPNRYATWFVDPPYNNAAGARGYPMQPGDFSDLAQWCRARLGQVIVCEQKGADWLPFRPHVNAPTNTKRVSQEVVWP